MSKDNPHDVTDVEIDNALRTARNLAKVLGHRLLVERIDALLDMAEAPGELTDAEWDERAAAKKSKALERARHESRHMAQVAHNKLIREGVDDAVAEWLASIFKNRHPSGIPSFEDGTDVKLTLKAGQVATGEHGEILYQVLVENRTKEVI